MTSNNTVERRPNIIFSVNTGSPRYIPLSFCVFLDMCLPILYVFQILKYVSMSMNLYIDNLK